MRVGGGSPIDIAMLHHATIDRETWCDALIKRHGSVGGILSKLSLAALMRKMQRHCFSVSSLVTKALDST
jgi:hypothetical protein